MNEDLAREVAGVAARPDTPSAEVRSAKVDAMVAVALIRANGGWKHRKGIPMTDEEVRRQGELAVAAVVQDIQRFAVARKVIDQLGRTAFYEQRLREEGLA